MLLVFGSINLDIAFSTQRLPAMGETVLGNHYLVSPGGKGANQAHAARLYGRQVALVGAVGQDAFAAPALERLTHSGIDLSGLQRLDAPTGCAGIVVDARGENSIVVAPGANLALRASHVSDAALARAGALLLQMETDAQENALLAARARAAGCRLIVLNNAPAQAIDAEFARHLDVLIVNEAELAETARAAGLPLASPEVQVRALAQRFGLIAVATQGPDGVLASDRGGEAAHVPAFVVPVTDTTGAGDTFCGVLAAALMEARPLADALVIACSAAALACTRIGAQVAQPRRADVLALASTRRPFADGAPG